MKSPAAPTASAEIGKRSRGQVHWHVQVSRSAADKPRIIKSSSLIMAPRVFKTE